MAITERLNFDSIFLFLFLILFPFGQIIRFGAVQLIDVAAGLAALYAIFARLKKPEIFRYFSNFLFVAAFSWILGSYLFWRTEVFLGLLYLVRLTAYFYFLVYVFNFVKEKSSNRELLLNSLLSVSTISAIFGWIQYFNFPSLRPFMVWGWDEHLYRLAGTFLDPTFLGIIIVFGLLITIYRYIVSAKKSMLLIAGFLLISLAFTYSRASYLAFLAGLAVIGIYEKKIKEIFSMVLGLILLILILPTSGNTILRITREFSALARLENYNQTIQIIKTSPVFGVGYNNLCLAKAGTSGVVGSISHACSGSDSSILFILATTGMVGLMILAYGVWGVAVNLKRSSYLIILSSAFTAILVHSIFSNSLVYPWVIGYLMILTAVTLGREV